MAIAAIYQRWTGHPTDTLLRWMREERWMRAGEAVADKFADEIVGGEVTPRVTASAAAGFEVAAHLTAAEREMRLLTMRLRRQAREES